MAFSRCPAQFYGDRSEILTIQTFTHTIIYVADVFPHFLGLVLIGREQPHYCRRFSAPVGAGYQLHRLLLIPVLVHVPLSTSVEKIANITPHSHIASWNAWLGRTMVRLR